MIKNFKQTQETVPRVRSRSRDRVDDHGDSVFVKVTNLPYEICEDDIKKFFQAVRIEAIELRGDCCVMKCASLKDVSEALCYDQKFLTYKEV
jgi:hypothetical protein